MRHEDAGGRRRGVYREKRNEVHYFGFLQGNYDFHVRYLKYHSTDNEKLYGVKDNNNPDNNVQSEHKKHNDIDYQSVWILYDTHKSFLQVWFHDYAVTYDIQIDPNNIINLL